MTSSLRCQQFKWLLVLLSVKFSTGFAPPGSSSLIFRWSLNPRASFHVTTAHQTIPLPDRTVKLCRRERLVRFFQSGRASSAISVVASSVLMAAVFRTLCLRLIAVDAWTKFSRAGGWMGAYATIPIVAGLVNMATNKLAVLMIFSPLEFFGIELVFYYCRSLARPFDDDIC